MAGDTKIRINELARELEVKAAEVLALLPAVGVTGKKSHSSSIDETEAEKIRDKLRQKKQAGFDAPRAELELPLPERPRPSAARPSAATRRTAAARPSIRIGGGGTKPFRPPVGGLKPPLLPKKEDSAPAASPPAVSSSAAESPPAQTTPAAGSPLVPPPKMKPPTATPSEEEIESMEKPEFPELPEIAEIAERPAFTPAPGRPMTPAPQLGKAVPKIPSPPTRTVQPAASPPPPPLPAAPPPSAAAAAPAAAAAANGAPTPPAPPAASAPAAPGAPQPRKTPGAPVAPRIPRGRPVRPPGVAPSRPKTRPNAPGAAAGAAAPGRAGGPGPRRPVLVPGKPIYQRRAPQGPVPGMPSPPPGAPPGYVPRRPLSPGGFQAGGPAMPAPAPGGAPGRPGAGRRPAGGLRRPRPAQTRQRDPEAEAERKILQRKRKAEVVKAVNTEIFAADGATVKELAEKLGIKANQIIKILVEKGRFATMNQPLDLETIKEIAELFGATATELTFEEETLLDLDQTETAENVEIRAPIVTVMGHVDHGKTSLLDAIRSTNVADREAGGITQAIGAYHVEKDGKRIVFIDTPGHEAFTKMRAQGASVTDIVVLVVAADDGLMPQTLEAIDHARAANVPIIAAVNKIDLPNAQPERAKQQLADRGLLAEDWGGDTILVNVSAKTGEGIDQLLEMINLVAEVRELKANASRSAIGVVLEAKLDRGKGPVATVLTQNGALRIGDTFIVGSCMGRVRAMMDDRGKQVKEAGPSSAVVVLGLDDLPDPGDQLSVVTDTERARKIAEYREQRARDQAMAKTSRLSLEQFQEQLAAGEVKELPVVLKADVQGSATVLEDTLAKLTSDKVKVRTIHSGVGAIKESDILLAITANAIVVGFNVRPERSASKLAEKENIDIRLHTVIYELVDELKKGMAGLLEPIVKEEFLGRADVLEIFNISKVGVIAGCLVTEGVAQSNAHARLLRDNVVVHTGKLKSLKRFKDDAKEVRAGQECGMGFERYNDLKQGDEIELFDKVEIKQNIDDLIPAR